MKNKPSVAIVRGKFLNAYEMQFFEPLAKDIAITAFGSLTSYHKKFVFPTILLPSPMDIPDVPYKLPILNRLFIDAHYLLGLEEKLIGYDLVHTAETYFHFTQQCLNAKRKGYVKKVIATVLENIPFNNEGIWGRKDFKQRARDELDHIIALTHKTKDALLTEGCDESKITVISHFIDTNKFHPVAKKLPKRDDSLTILFSGRLEYYKGVFDVIETAKKLLSDAPLHKYNLHFVFVGSGSSYAQMITTEKEFGITDRITHTHVSYEDMPDQYRNADIFIAPSKPTPTYEEQYCTALLEAQASGLPIVTTRSGGIPENIGDAGILINPGDIDGLYRALKKFILSPNLRAEYAKRARIRAEKVHDISIGAKKIKALYTSVLNS